MKVKHKKTFFAKGTIAVSQKLKFHIMIEVDVDGNTNDVKVDMATWWLQPMNIENTQVVINECKRVSNALVRAYPGSQVNVRTLDPSQAPAVPQS